MPLISIQVFTIFVSVLQPPLIAAMEAVDMLRTSYSVNVAHPSFRFAA